MARLPFSFCGLLFAKFARAYFNFARSFIRRFSREQMATTRRTLCMSAILRRASFRLSILISRLRGCYARYCAFRRRTLCLSLSLSLSDYSDAVAVALARPPRLHCCKYLSRSSHLLFMSFIYSAETAKLNFPRFLDKARAEYDIIKNKTAFEASGARAHGPGINSLFPCFSNVRNSSCTFCEPIYAKYIAFISFIYSLDYRSLTAVHRKFEGRLLYSARAW